MHMKVFTDAQYYTNRNRVWTKVYVKTLPPFHEEAAITFLDLNLDKD